MFQAYGTPQKIINILSDMYANNQCCVRHGGQQSDWFTVKSGFRQGCIISPLLFLIAINQQPRGITWKAFNHLKDEDFANDIAIIALSQKDMQEKTICVETTARSIGLKLSHPKSKVLKINIKSNSDVLIDGNCVGNVTDFKYLGSYLTADSNINREITTRIVMASTVFYKLNNIWMSNKIKKDTKSKLCTSNVRSVLPCAQRHGEPTEGLPTRKYLKELTYDQL
ncbi:hypothetical protein ElyMa_000730500 [Elysia marginata]|uniref:Reverse transcriptase domain-containing protein n=1 Tax=Elysia marginata TaxID=1093978 RepID=A0AAV4GM12_9GAST|nr:hypothetical protein ElyMa_000730500 [Elysia marginata]